jgi:hypothetical protein
MRSRETFPWSGLNTVWPSMLSGVYTSFIGNSTRVIFLGYPNIQYKVYVDYCEGPHAIANVQHFFPCHILRRRGIIISLLEDFANQGMLQKNTFIGSTIDCFIEERLTASMISG